MTKKILLLLSFLLLLLTGCGSAPEETTLSLNKKGVLTQVIVEEWDQEYYDQSELESELKAAVDANPKVSLKSLRVKNGKATAKLIYESAEAYREFNGVTCFWGTTAEAVSAGYSLAGEYLDTEGKKVALSSLLNGEKACYVLVMTEPAVVELPGKILCASSAVEILDAKRARVTTKRVQPNTDKESNSGDSVSDISEIKDSADSQKTVGGGEEKDGLQLWLDEPACIIYQ